MNAPLKDTLQRWSRVPPARFVGGNQVELLQGGDALFPRMCEAIAAAQHEVWLATYIFHDDPAGQRVAQALKDAAARGVAVHVVVDGFGSIKAMARVRALFAGSAVRANSASAMRKTLQRCRCHYGEQHHLQQPWQLASIERHQARCEGQQF